MDGLDLRLRRHTVRQPGFAGEFRLRDLDVDADLDLLHGWMNDPEIAEYWKMPWPRERVRDYLHRQVGLAHSTPFVGELDGTAISYWELYRADLDPLAEHYPALPNDAGVHLMFGPRYRGRGLAVDLLHTVTGWQLDADPAATRVIGEPDAANERVIHTAAQAGFRRVGTMQLPHKRAALLIRYGK